MFSRYRLLILGSLVWIILDQWSKIAMVDWLVPGGLPATAAMIRSEVHTVSETWFKFRVVGNPGAAWGMFRAFPTGPACRSSWSSRARAVVHDATSTSRPARISASTRSR
jgi:hypothetical protein